MHGKILEISPWHTWCDAVMAVATRAKAALPQCARRIDHAIHLALAGDVRLFEDGTALVASQNNGHTAYRVAAGGCECPDAAKAPSAMCQHRLAVAIATRAYTDATQRGKRTATHTNGHRPLRHATDVVFTATTSAVKDGVAVSITLQRPCGKPTAFYAELARLPEVLRDHGYIPSTPAACRLAMWCERLKRSRRCRTVLLVWGSFSALSLLWLPFPYPGIALFGMLLLLLLVRKELHT